MLKIYEQYYLVSSTKFNSYTYDVKYRMEHMFNALDGLNNFAKSY